MSATQNKIAIIGVGYVGLALAISFVEKGISVIGVEKSHSRRDEISQATFDGSAHDKVIITDALVANTLELTDDLVSIKHSNCIVLCLPTPTDENHTPDYSILAEVCKQVSALSQPGQTIILTSTSFIGTTRQFLVRPLEARGFVVGHDIFIAFSPERVDPGNPQHRHSEVDRVLAGATDSCFNKALSHLQPAVSRLHRASSLEVAEMTKLVENSFRAVNIAWINEMANLAAQKSVNISEVVELANTKPYGFMKFTPGSGAGGHCIPADPHYLLMESVANTTPITTLAMQEIHRRPVSIANQAAGLLRSKELSQSRVLIWGVAYKPNVSDVRESPALAIIGELLNQGMRVDYHDPLVDEVEVNSIPVLGISEPEFAKYDLIILHTIHDSGVPEQIFELGKEILDTTFKFTNRSRVVTPA